MAMCGRSMANKCTPSQCGVMHCLSNGCRTTIPFGQSQGVRQSVSSEASASFIWLIGARNLHTVIIKHFAG